MTRLKRLQHFRCLFMAWAGIALLCAGGTTSAADDPQRFLDALRDRGYYDVALDYLSRLQAAPQVEANFKKRIPYEEATTLISAATAERDGEQKAKHLNAARDKLTEFVKSQPDPELAAEAESQLGNILVERAKSLLHRAKQPRFAAQKTALTDEARGLFTEAQAIFDSSEKKYVEHFKQLPKTDGSESNSETETRREAWLAARRAQLWAAQAMYEAAPAYPTDSAERKKRLETAATKFAELHEKNRRLLIGLLARVYQGRCYLDLGETKRALGIFEEVLAQPDSIQDTEQQRRLKIHVLNLAMQAWTSDGEKNYETAAQRGLEVVGKNTRNPLLRGADGLAIRYYTALALKKYGESIGEKDPGRKRQALSEARKQAKEAAASGGEHQEAAKQLMQELVGAAEGDDKPVANFADANERGKEALDLMQARLAQIKTAAADNEQDNVASFERESNEARDKAREYFRLALSLRAATTPPDDVNNARYFLCYLAYNAGDYWDACVLGEFLATRHPTSAWSRQAARVALSSFLQLYNTSPPEERNDAKRRMAAFADYLTRRFAGEAEADEAWMSLMVIATGERNVDEVLGFLAKIPETSPRRAEAELKAGQALWVAALTAVRQPEESRPPQPEIEKMRTQARDLLVQGVERITKSDGGGEVNFTMAAAALSLAQIYVETGQADAAVKLLEDPRIGPLALVAAKSPITDQGTFAIEAYKAGLRAYVATQQLEKAETVMAALEARVTASGDAGASQMLVAIYRALGQELENHVASLRNEHKSDDLAAVSKGFELFLDRIVAKQEGNNFNSLNWVAETYSRLGAGNEARDQSVSPQARAYFDKAAATDQKILQEIAKNPDFATPEAALAVKLRLAKSQRRGGHFKEAIDLLAEVATKMPMLLEVQKEAAYTYQDWGRENPATYALAIGGGRKTKGSNGKEFNLLWGWTQLAKLTQRDKKHQDVFHEARYNMANCWLLFAKTQNGSEKSESLKKAEAAITLTAQLHPDLGGGDWPKKYDQLFRQIQHEAGQPETGLPATKPNETGKASTTTAAVK